jgi:TonB family protein
MNMSCNDIASILDTHRSARLAPAERTQVDAHLAACADCTAVWTAQTELLALRVPPVPATLLERALLASRLPQSAPARRARTPLVLASVLLAGAAAAAVTIVSMTREQTVPTASSAEVEPSAAPAAGTSLDRPGTQVDETSATPVSDGVTSVELVETALSIAPIVRRPPAYPPAALEQGLEGHVQLKFDVTAAGVVENISVVESSDALFEDSAVRALAEWRYLPRIVAGKRVASEGIHTITRFALSGAPAVSRPTISDAQLERERAEAQRQSLAYSDGLEVALDRLAADDLRGAELQLDEMQAIFGAERVDLWSFYGYLYTVQGNYSRAIDAYETAVALTTRVGFTTSGPAVALATLYFARHQYDLALKTLAAYRDRIAATQTQNPGRPYRPLEDEAVRLYERLRALGVTDEPL